MENKSGKYFKYAIGEIVLVVIGILIALSINNWNEDRKGKSLAKQYANALVRDLKQDTIGIKYDIDYHKRTTAGLDSIITFKNKDLNQPNINDSLYILIRKYCFSVVEFRNNENTLIQLKSTGNLVLFNEKTKDSIISFEMSTIDLKEQGSYYRNAYLNNLDILKKNIDFTVLLDSIYFKKGKYTGKTLPKTNYAKNSTMELFNEISMLKAISKNYSDNFLNSQLDKTERLIELLTKEYDIAENEMKYNLE